MIRTEIFALIAKKFGTPAYVYQRKRFQDQLRALAFGISYRPLTILFAIKANSSFRVLRTLALTPLPKEVRFGVDAVSPGEVALSLMAGIRPNNILFTGNNPSDEEMEVIVGSKILPNIDSLSRLEWFGRKYPGRDVCVRINHPNVGAGHHDHCITCGPTSKFGIWHTEAVNAVGIAKHYNLRIVGVHQHIGSQILDPNKFFFAMEAMFQVAPIFPDLDYVDFGGGFGVSYRPEEPVLDVAALGRGMSERFEEFCKRYGKKLRMVIEPGRYLTAEAGYLLVRVTTVKQNPDGRIFVGVDSGFNHLVRPAMYNSYHYIRNISNPAGLPMVVDIVGNLCESGDKFAVQREISHPLKGDLLLIENAGAYGFSMSSTYNLRPLPPEIMVTPAGAIQEIRKRQTIKDLIGGV